MSIVFGDWVHVDGYARVYMLNKVLFMFSKNVLHSNEHFGSTARGREYLKLMIHLPISICDLWKTRLTPTQNHIAMYGSTWNETITLLNMMWLFNGIECSSTSSRLLEPCTVHTTRGLVPILCFLLNTTFYLIYTTDVRMCLLKCQQCPHIAENNHWLSQQRGNKGELELTKTTRSPFWDDLGLGSQSAS